MTTATFPAMKRYLPWFIFLLLGYIAMPEGSIWLRMASAVFIHIAVFLFPTKKHDELIRLEQERHAKLDVAKDQLAEIREKVEELSRRAARPTVIG